MIRFRCENSLSIGNPSQSVKDEAFVHGLGTVIMQDIANKYSGTYQVEKSEKVYTVTVIMPAK